MKTSIEPLVDAPPADPAALPQEWAEWSEEPGQRVSIEDDGRIVGMLHVTVVGPAEGWLEGLWVQPAARGRGVGRRLVQEAEDLLHRCGVGTVRTAIPSRDYTALAVAEHAGFSRHTETNVLVADIEAGPIDIAYDAQVRPADPPESGAILRVLGASPLIGAWRGLVPLGWRFRALQPELVKGLINDGRVVRSGESVEGVAAFAVHGSTAVIFFLEGPRGHHEALFGAIAEHARGAGASRIALFTPEPAPPSGIRANFTPHAWCPDGLVIVEKPAKPRPRRSRR